MSSLQDLFNRVAGRSLYCAQVVPGFHKGSALEAAFIAIYRHRMVRCHQHIEKHCCVCMQVGMLVAQM